MTATLHMCTTGSLHEQTLADARILISALHACICKTQCHAQSCYQPSWAPTPVMQSVRNRKNAASMQQPGLNLSESCNLDKLSVSSNRHVQSAAVGPPISPSPPQLHAAPQPSRQGVPQAGTGQASAWTSLGLGSPVVSVGTSAAMAMSNSARAAAVSAPGRQEGTALAGMAATWRYNNCNIQHTSAASVAAGNDAPAPAAAFRCIASSPADLSSDSFCTHTDSNDSAPPSAQNGSISTLSTGRFGTSTASVVTTPQRLPESRHSKGLQQLWNCVAHTPLAVPSPHAVTDNHSQASPRLQYGEQSQQPSLLPYLARPVAAPQSSPSSAPQAPAVGSSEGSGMSEAATAGSTESTSMSRGEAKDISPER